MVKALFDTNILIDYLNAVPEARTEFQRYTEKAISVITELIRLPPRSSVVVENRIVSSWTRCAAPSIES